MQFLKNDSTAVPGNFTPAPQQQDDVSDGHCDDTNTYIVVYVAGFAALLLLMLFCRYSFGTVPSRGSARSFGRPYTIVSFLFTIGLWNMIPQAVTFLLFHIATTSIFALQENAACIMLLGIPIVPAYLLLMGLCLLVFYDAELMKATMSDIVNPTGASTIGKQTLILGVTARGMMYIDALEKQQNRAAGMAATCIVDYARHWRPFVAHNAEASGIAAKTVEDSFFDAVTTSDGNEFGLPFADRSFDRLVLTPFIRNAIPVGEFTVGEAVKHRRMQRMLREGLRVLKPNGEVVCVDQAANAIAIWADLRDAGLSPVLEETGVEVGPNILFRKKCLKVVAVNSASGAAPFSIQSGDMSPLLGQGPGASGSRHGQPPALSERVLCYAFQALLSVVLVFAAFAVYASINFPTSIPLSQRVNNLVVNFATSYPIMAYFSSEARFNGDDVSPSASAMFVSLVRSELLALAAALLFTLLFGLPTLILQIALASTSLSSDTRSYIGMGISVFIAIQSFKRGRAQMQESAAAKRNIPATYVDYMR